VVLGGITIADTRAAFRVLETSHPPNYYFPPTDVRADAVERTTGSSFCEWKGTATYWTVRAGERVEADAAWSYPRPTAGYEMIRDHLAFYAGRMDACYVDEELVTPQPGGFYGGWITSEITGPFKGGPGTRGW
jgi:uncharacterized protein (DUF427 family)